MSASSTVAWGFSSTFVKAGGQDPHASVAVALGKVDKLLWLMGGLPSPSSALAPRTGGISFQQNSAVPS